MAFEIGLIVACLAFGASQVSGQACGGIIGPKSGDILSPGYSTQNEYANNLDCVWTINAPINGTIELRFVEFNVEGADYWYGYEDNLNYGDYPDAGKNCPYDYVTIAGAANVEASSKFCGFLDPQTINSIGDTMSVTFHTDIAIGNPGFKLEVRLISPPEG